MMGGQGDAISKVYVVDDRFSLSPVLQRLFCMTSISLSN